MEEQLRLVESSDIQALEGLKATCERLTIESQKEQEKYQVEIAKLKAYYEEEGQRESAMFHQAMDEMEEQSKNILRECKVKVDEKEAQIIEQREELRLLSTALNRHEEKLKLYEELLEKAEGQLRGQGARHHHHEAEITRLEVENQREIERSRHRYEVESQNHHRDTIEIDRLQREIDRLQKQLRTTELASTDL